MADGGRRGFAAGGEVVLALMEYGWAIGRGAGGAKGNHVSVWDGLFFNRWDALV